LGTKKKKRRERGIKQSRSGREKEKLKQNIEGSTTWKGFSNTQWERGEAGGRTSVLTGAAGGDGELRQRCTRNGTNLLASGDWGKNLSTGQAGAARESRSKNVEKDGKRASSEPLLEKEKGGGQAK